MSSRSERLEPDDQIEGSGQLTVGAEVVERTGRQDGNLGVRPEIRWDWSDTEIPVLAAGAFDDFSADSKLTDRKSVV